MPEKTLVAQLPPMRCEDYERFEKEGGVWGEQRGIRRQQVRVLLATSAAVTLGGTYWVRIWRRNTNLVAACVAPGFTVFGAVLGNYLGVVAFPSVACNKETTMMRRVWWAKECSKGWDMSQVDASKWAAQYPHAKSLGGN